MSWIDRVKNDIIITTGDGKRYEPLYMIGTKQVAYNIAEFNFPNVEGTLVRRGTPQGARYDISIVFQGEMNVDISRDFERSCANSNHWVINHPMYGDFNCQPTTLTFNSSGLSMTRVTGTVIETILEDYPTAIPDPAGTARDYFDEHLERMVVSFDNVSLKPSQGVALAEINQNAFDTVTPQIRDGIQYNDFFNVFNTANTAVINATSQAGGAIGAVYRVVTYPSLLKQSVRSRLGLLQSQLNQLLGLLSFENAQIYEAQAGALISGMILTAVTPQENDYQNAVEVLEISDIIVQSYNDYVTNLDTVQSPDGIQLDSYIPAVEPLTALSDGVYFTVSQLMQLALQAQQERVFVLDTDMDVINLTHRFYGLDLADANLERLMESNNIGISELLEVKKGRKIIYYV